MRTKESHAKYMREYNSIPLNREKKRIRDREYGRKNIEKALIRAKEWANKHKEHRKEYLKRYYHDNKEKLDKNNRKYESENKERLAKLKNEKTRQRRLIDVDFKLKKILRRSLWGYVKRGKKSGSAVRDLGCTVNELKLHLEKQFKEGMTWENWSLKGWHIDHIKPLSKFNLKERREFLEACNYKNLQPLWAKENIRKSNR